MNDSQKKIEIDFKNPPKKEDRESYQVTEMRRATVESGLFSEDP